ncbi:endonuclease domain-containing protein [Streptomyces olivaceus]|uniref:endonuclease domain-containing protein n=1 Tax=Streptomyces olivaceus TaxID=47716 RepID=UPI00355889C3
MVTCGASGVGWTCDRVLDRFPLVRGLCMTHYAQLRRRGTLAPIDQDRASSAGQRCEAPGCGRAVSAQRLCGGHYQQWRRGEELSPLRVKRANGAVQEMVRRGIVECLHCREYKRVSDYSVLNASGSPRPYCKKCNAERVRLDHYNVTKEFVGRLLLHQGGKCAICGTAGSAEAAMHIDHDHACCPGRRSCGACVRGLLCNRCNHQGLGWYEALPYEVRTFGLLNDYLADPPAKRLRAEQAPPAAA